MYSGLVLVLGTCTFVASAAFADAVTVLFKTQRRLPIPEQPEGPIILCTVVWRGLVGLPAGGGLWAGGGQRAAAQARRLAQGLGVLAMLKPGAFALLLILLLMAAFLSCGVVGGKPSTSAPGGIDNPDELLRACSERDREIDEWKRREERKLEDDFIEEGKSIWQIAARLDQIDRDARAMSRDVKGVDKTYQWGGAKVYHQRGHWPA